MLEKFKFLLAGTGNRITKVLFLLMLVMLSSANTFAAGNESVSYEGTVFVIVIAAIIVLLAFFLAGHNKSKEEEKGMMSKLGAVLNDSKPIEKEKDILLDHDYDGIRELDNNLPPWWKYLFYVTIIFAVVYLVSYHIVGSGPSSAQEYVNEMKDAEIQKAKFASTNTNIDETNVTILKDEGSLASGAETFKKNCVSCHGPEGGGLVGPNLTDNYWIHGGEVKSVFTTIKNGVLDKGMISWKTQLSAVQMQQVASYILVKLHGTKPASVKAKMDTEVKFYDPANPDAKDKGADTTKKGA